MAFNGANKSIGIAEHAFMEQQNDHHSQSANPGHVAVAQQSGIPTNLTEENYQPAHGVRLLTFQLVLFGALTLVCRSNEDAAMTT